MTILSVTFRFLLEMFRCNKGTQRYGLNKSHGASGRTGIQKIWAGKRQGRSQGDKQENKFFEEFSFVLISVIL